MRTGLVRFVQRKDLKIWLSIFFGVSLRVWVLSGSLENWERGVSSTIWGTKPKLKHLWEKISKGDVLIFYVTRPVSGVVGVGTVENKFKQETPLWSDEIREGKVIYPYGFEFKVVYVLPLPSWNEKKISVKDLDLKYWAAINSLEKTTVIKALFERISATWNISLTEIQGLEEEKAVPEKQLSLHDEIQEKIFEIGKARGFISEKEYPMDGQRLDVIWRAAGVVRGVPKYVFEIEIEGELYRSLAKLKHAYDLWAFPKLFLITKTDKIGQVENLLSGTFREIKDILKIIDVEKIEEFYMLQMKEKELKDKLGF